MTLDWSPFATLILVRLEWAIFVYFFIINSFYALLLLSAIWDMLKHVREIRGASRWRILGCRTAPTISMLAPAHNEAASIRESIHAVLSLSYPNLEVVVVNDGSRDETLSILTEHFALVPIHPIYRRQI